MEFKLDTEDPKIREELRKFPTVSDSLKDWQQQLLKSAFEKKDDQLLTDGEKVAVLSHLGVPGAKVQEGGAVKIKYEYSKLEWSPILQKYVVTYFK